MITSEQCKSYAAECRRLAQSAPSPEQRNILFDLAREWDRVANQTERLERQKTTEERKEE
jgi:hypothetical protein